HALIASVSCRSSGLIGSEAVDETAAAGTAQVVEAAAAVGAARGMRRIPRVRRDVIAQARAVAVADHRRALGAAGPVAAGPIFRGREGRAVHLRASLDGGCGGGVAGANEHVAAFRAGGLGA